MEHDRESFVTLCGWLAILGCVAMAVGVVAGDLMVPGNDWVSDTISAMAAGNPLKWVVDAGIIAYAAGIAFAALGAATLHPGGRRWSLGAVGLVVIAVTVFLIGFRDEYGDGDAERAEAYHQIFVYILGAAFAAVPWALSDKAADYGGRYRTALLAASVLWIVLAPAFLLSPDWIDGALERALMGVTFIAVVALGILMIRGARFA